MAFIRKIRRDGKSYDIAAKNLVNGFTQTTPGVNALDAKAGKTLNDSVSQCATKAELADCVRMPYVNATIPANTATVNDITATVPSGYTFIGWVYCASVGWVGHVYPASNSQTTSFWTSNGNSTNARKFNAFYLVRKNA